MYRLLLVALLAAGNLNPDFAIPNENGQQVFREELAIAMAKTPGANVESRKTFKHEAEQLAQRLFRKGQDAYDLPHKKLVVYWDSIRLDEIGASKVKDGQYEIHLHEIMFFTYHRDYLESVIPHEVGHLLHAQQWGTSNSLHDETFEWVVKEIEPNYEFRNLDKTPACRFLKRLIATYGYSGPVPVCE